MTQTSGGQTSINDLPSMMSFPVTQTQDATQPVLESSFTQTAIPSVQKEMSENEIEQVSYNDFSEFMSGDI
jgi:hypothetical protein